jgi:hypothetical protein
MEYKITYYFWKVVWKIQVSAKWMYFVKKTQLILEFSFAIPGTSGAIERVFSITNALWTDERSHFLVDTIKAVIVTKTFWGTITQQLLYSDFKQSQITSRNSFNYEL